LKREALEAGATEAQCEAIEQKVNQIVEESVKFADESPFPTPDELYKDVYAESDYPYIHY
jgi:pyruvate dehydrogenase E1 component alpha subunit